MANKERIDYLLLDIRELEKNVAGIRDVDFYPVSFFSQTFELAHKILTDLHSLESDQVEELRKQMEEHQKLIGQIPPAKPDKTFEANNIPESIEEQALSIEQPQDITEAANTLANTPGSVANDIPDPSEATLFAETIITEETTITESKFEVIEPTLLSQQTFDESKLFHKEKETVAEKKSTVFLNELLEKKQLSDFTKAFSLNDRFRFRRELFGGDETKMAKAITDLNDIRSYEESIQYLNEVLNWNVEDEAVADFIKLLEKRFL